MNDKDVAIVTASDANYLPAACCQLVSSATHLDGMTNVQLFLVVCDVSDKDLSDARAFFDQRGISVEIVVPDFVDEISTLKTRWPRAAYLRLYFDRIFDSRWRRVVYFDADTRVSSSLVRLVQADLAGKPVGAVHDFILYVTGNIHRRRRDLFLADDAPYLQSGVMVFDWPKVLAGDDLAVARRFLAEHPEACYEAPDQDALNATFENRWTPLDPRWNLHEIYLMYGKVIKPHLRHFTSAKPWASNRPRAWRDASAWYKAELAESPWPDFVASQSFLQATQADLKFMAKRYYPGIRERLMKWLPASLGQRLPRGRYMPWVPRRNQDVEDMASALIREAEGACPALRPPEAVLAGGHWQAAT
jgi:lipopolysaccharide biosynthesis glycosyltransferase